MFLLLVVVGFWGVVFVCLLGFLVRFLLVVLRAKGERSQVLLKISTMYLSKYASFQ